jgi:hypothetical protein
MLGNSASYARFRDRIGADRSRIGPNRSRISADRKRMETDGTDRTDPNAPGGALCDDWIAPRYRPAFREFPYDRADFCFVFKRRSRAFRITQS